ATERWKRLTAMAGSASFAATLAFAVPAHVSAQAGSSLPAVIVTGVAADNSSAKIDFLPVAGAKDYRIYDVSNPMEVKYAGMRHLDAGPINHFVTRPDGTPVYPFQSVINGNGVTQPKTLDVPSTEIQWNLLDDGQPHTLVVQAVDSLGPVPLG